MSEQFKRRLKVIIDKYKRLDKQAYGLAGEELRVFNEEIQDLL